VSIFVIYIQFFPYCLFVKTASKVTYTVTYSLLNPIAASQR